MRMNASPGVWQCILTPGRAVTTWMGSERVYHMMKSRRLRASPVDRALPRRLRAAEPPPVPTVSPDLIVGPPRVTQEPLAEEPAEEAVRRMVEAAYT